MATKISPRCGFFWRNLLNGKFDNQILKENPVLENWWGGGNFSGPAVAMCVDRIKIS
ncbi:hypothetical protein [Aquiflexum gelatinilyticum]|uniref:Uncharacterized protein n=1 Tax=Aquiflexum gelatinilyticum TaxID=2961943 RepID=A0A9X2P4E8_9BACT|nr:hypothetical protein [Aquiflexum gelatinilyticum]MCR9015773.1 hypothetical protein [Aquiflexum gelatinilyticum]